MVPGLSRIPGRADRPGDLLLARVEAVEVGVVVVRPEAGGPLLRAAYGGGLLADLARDRGCAPVSGDRVAVRCWPDGRHTVERRLLPELRVVAPRVAHDGPSSCGSRPSWGR